MEFETVTSRDALPVEQLRQFDASFSTSMVYGVATTDLGFTLVEQELADPFTKRYTLLDDLEDEHLPWDVLILARSAGELVGLTATSFSAWNRRQILSELHVAPAAGRWAVPVRPGPDNRPAEPGT